LSIKANIIIFDVCGPLFRNILTWNSIIVAKALHLKFLTHFYDGRLLILKDLRPLVIAKWIVTAIALLRILRQGRHAKQILVKDRFSISPWVKQVLSTLDVQLFQSIVKAI
jgi:hypothetical protein